MIGLSKHMTRGALVIGFLSIAVAVTMQWAGFLYNVSRSAPRGLYRRIPKPGQLKERSGVAQAAELQTYVFFCPTQQWPGFRDNPNYRIGWASNCPDGFEALIKPVAAWPGDNVTVAPLGVAVNGTFVHNSMALSKDANSKELHHYAFGNYKVGAGEIWVISAYSPKSFDSRYFGPIPIRAVKVWAAPFLTEHNPR